MADSELRRTHPATVALRTVGALGQAIGALIAMSVFGSLGGRESLVAALGLGGLLLLVTVATLGIQWLNWHYFRYGIAGDHLVINEGWLVRKRRSIPLARVQGVDVRAGVVMRLFGMADVVVQTAGGGAGEPEAKIGAIALSDAERIRSELLHGRVGIGTTGDVAVVGADPIGRMSDLRGAFGGLEAGVLAPTFEYRVGIGRLVLAAITSGSVPLVMGAIVGAASQLVDVGGDEVFEGATQAAVAAGVIGMVLGGLALLASVIAVAVAVTVSRDYGFVVRRVEDRLETEAGLFERRMTGVPVSRIQTVSIDQSALRRALGWASVGVVTAGFGRGEDQQSTTAASLVPIARMSEVDGLMDRLLPESADFPLTGPLPLRAARFYTFVPTTSVLVLGALVVLTLATQDAAWAAVGGVGGAIGAALTAAWCIADWAQTACGTDSRALAVQRGVLGRYRVRVPRSRIQSLSVRANPFQRRAGLATLVVATVSGSTKALYRVRNMDSIEAERVAAWYSDRTV